MIASTKQLFQNNPFLVLGLWLTAVPWLLFPTIAPLATAVSLILLFILLLGKPTLSRFVLQNTSINGYLLVFLLLTGLAYLVSPLPEVSLPKLTVTLLGLVTFFLILPSLDNIMKVERLISMMALCAGLVILVGFFTLEWPGRQILNLEPITDRLPHLSGSFSINYNEMAGTLLMFFPFVLAALRRGDGRLQRAIFLLILISLLALLILTQSRNGLMGMMVIGLTWLLWGRISFRKIVTPLIIVGVICLSLFLMMGLTLSALFDGLSIIDAASKQGDAPPTSWLTRLEIWQVGWQMLADYSAVGGGLYTFDPVSRANYLYETILPGFNLTHAHNLFIQTGASLGISGILALVGIWATVIVKLWQVSGSDNERVRQLSAVFASAIAGYLFFNLFDTITFGQKPGLFLWFILAGSVGLFRLYDEQTSIMQFGSNSNEPRRLSVIRVISFVPLLTLIILLLSPLFPRNLINLQLDKARFQTGIPLILVPEDFPGDARRAGLVHYLGGNRDEALSVWRVAPDGAAYLQSQGTIALVAGRTSDAIAWYDLALELDPVSAVTYLWRGSANEERGTIALAEADFQKAILYSSSTELNDSTRGFIHYRLGLILRGRQDWQGAAEAFAQAAAYQPEIGAYYQVLGDALTALGDQAGATAAYQKARQE